METFQDISQPLRDRQAEFLINTINFYSEDTSRRAFAFNEKGEKCGCMYLTPEGKRCGIGRWYVPEDQTYHVTSIMNELPLWLQSLGMRFLVEIQDLHDMDDYWNQNGLNELGYDKVERIVEEFNLQLNE